MLRKIGTFIFAMILPGLVSAGHHEEGEALRPAAKSGQVIVAYSVPCVDPAAGVAILKELIAYESDAAPVDYSSVATIIDDETVGAVDVHTSNEAMQKAFAWQEQDEKWLGIQARALGICEADVNAIATAIHVAQ
ncbi:MAG: hypothetical protein ACPHAN_12685 [Pseudomonadales bacterium]